MKLDTRVEQALRDINFVERYEALSNKFSRGRTPKEKALDYYDGDFFFSLKKEKNGQYEFGFKFSLEYGMVELIWDLKDSNQKVLLGTNLFTIVRLLTSPENKIMDPIISDYVDFRDVMKIAFEMYEDFKQAFLKISEVE